MPLYARLMGLPTAGGRIPIHAFQAIVAEWARGQITAQQARDGIARVSADPLTAGEETEAQTLVNTVPTGTTALLKAERALRLLEIDQVLLLASSGVAPYDVEATIKTRLGV